MAAHHRGVATTDGDRLQASGDSIDAPQPDGGPRLAALLADLELRLLPVCHDMAPADFQALIRDVAVKLRWAGSGRATP